MKSNLLFFTIVSFFHQVFPQCIPLESRMHSKVIIVDGDIAIIDHGDFDVNPIRLEKEVPAENHIWPNGLIPYEYHPSVSSQLKKTIESAMRYWESKTCIRFKYREATDNYWITFRSDSTGCYSFVGRDPSCRNQGQPVSLSRGCDSFLVAVHELGHVVGLHHQHNRWDRDDYIHINWQNLMNGSHRFFKKEIYETFGVPYDFTSVMHYNSWHFSQDVTNKSTIVALDPHYQRFVGRSSGLSFRDRKTVYFLYGCNASCVNLGETKCANEGFLARNSDLQNQDCICACPPNVQGSHCESKSSDDYYESQDPLLCGDIITQSNTEIQIPQHLNSSQSPNCVWIIRGPEDKRVQLTFHNFSFAPRTDLNIIYNVTNRPPIMKCVNESLEIRLDDRFDGSFFCGDDILPGTVMTSQKSTEVIIILTSLVGSKASLSATVTFQPIPVKSFLNSTSTTTTTTKRPTTNKHPVGPFPLSLTQVTFDSLRQIVAAVRNVVLGSKNGV